jgi:hypothetical protein
VLKGNFTEWESGGLPSMWSRGSTPVGFGSIITFSYNNLNTVHL